MGWLGAMFTGGLISGSGIWTLVVDNGPVLTWRIVAVGLRVVHCVSVLTLPHVRPGQQMEEVAT